MEVRDLPYYNKFYTYEIELRRAMQFQLNPHDGLTVYPITLSVEQFPQVFVDSNFRFFVKQKEK